MHKSGIIKVAFYASMRDTNVVGGNVGCCGRFMRWLQYIFSKESDSKWPYFEHVEVMLPNGAVTSSTQSGGGVHYSKDKFLRNDGYTHMLSFPLTYDQERCITQMALDMAQRKVGFNTAGFRINFLPILGRLMPMRRQGRLVFCSEYATMLLQSPAVGFLKGIQAHTVSPSALYKLMSMAGAVSDYNHKRCATQKTLTV